MSYGGRDKEASWAEASGLIDSAAHFQPDLFLLPELFLTGDEKERFSDPEYIEYPGSPMLLKIGAKAAERHAYIAAPVVYRAEDGVHNTTVLFDRRGRQVFTYHKAFPTSSERDHGILAGPLNPPCYDAEFGRIGMAICFDANFEPVFAHYRQQKIKLLLFSSYFPGGFILRQLAWRGHHYVMSSHAQGYENAIIDDYARVVATGNMFARALCWEVNLDSIVLPLYANWGPFPRIRERFGDQVLVEAFREEDRMRLVSNMPDKTVDDVVQECGLVRLETMLDDAIARCAEVRPSSAGSRGSSPRPPRARPARSQKTT
jgi:hypothetical protein